MDVRGFLQATTRQWPVVVGSLLAGLLTAWVVTAATDSVYEARTQLFVATRAAADTGQLHQSQSFSQARVRSYAAIVASRQVTQPVAKQLKLPGTPDELASRITADAPRDTVLINITVRDTDADRAARTADAVALRFSKVVERLETPRGGTSAGPETGAAGSAPQLSPVSLGITQQAAVPVEPVTPEPLRNLGIGLLGGLLLGASLAVLRETLDTTLKTTEALAECTSLPVLAAVPYDSAAPEQPLITGAAAASPRAEAFRRLRTNLRFAQVDERPRVIVVTSPLAGEGKTDTAANLALALADSGVSVCLVDADLRRPTVASTLGLVQDAGLTTVLVGNATLEEVTQQAAGTVAVLTTGVLPPNPTELLASDRMGELLRELADRYETVIVDTAPLLPVADTLGLAPHAQGALLVVRAASTPREQAAQAADALRAVGVRTLGAVFTMAPAAKDGGGYGTYGGGSPRGEGDEAAPPRPDRGVREPLAPALSHLAGDK
ncbi:polysaccharide biosynthesis tyrosine autokinase [Streptomyces sp. E11-3]|uniref:polysaccharide biosynthesis tyrosine autokinase n=1 Tax=Streptomyces sp. E11-3 TaxID=3110112 RepID=UPI00397F3805